MYMYETITLEIGSPYMPTAPSLGPHLSPPQDPARNLVQAETYVRQPTYKSLSSIRTSRALPLVLLTISFSTIWLYSRSTPFKMLSTTPTAIYPQRRLTRTRYYNFLERVPSWCKFRALGETFYLLYVHSRRSYATPWLMKT